MRPTCVYIYPLDGEQGFADAAYRFLESYAAAPPGADHDTVVVCNGGPVDTRTELLFSSLPRLSLLHHDNSGFDIGGFQAAARAFPCELMVFFGASTYFRRKGWMDRILTSFQRHGDALYGCTSNSGNPSFGVHPHIRTTAFWMNPALFSAYPSQIKHPHQRYPFEHGANCLTSWVRSIGREAWVVSWEGEHPFGQWGSFVNGFHHGDQSNVIIGDRLTCPPYYPVP